MKSIRKIFSEKQDAWVFYGLTPPKKNHTREKLDSIAAKHLERIASVVIDGLILYDIQAEQSRTHLERPFPYIETLDPVDYRRDYLSALSLPTVLYRCVGKYTREQLNEFLNSADVDAEASVFVGAASREEPVALKMTEAYVEKRQTRESLFLGGVVIPERHAVKGSEDQRLLNKTQAGCEFFVSQAVYNLDYSKNLLNDYAKRCEETGQVAKPVLFTFSACGSLKTLDFMKWLGISLPDWIEERLLKSENILHESYELCLENYRALLAEARQLGIQIGANVESVAIRREEIELSLEMVRAFRTIGGA